MSDHDHEATADDATTLRANLTGASQQALVALAEEAKFIRALKKHDAELAGLLAAVNKARTDLFRKLAQG